MILNNAASSSSSGKYTRWFKYDWDYLCVNKSQFVPVIFEPPCVWDLIWFAFGFERKSFLLMEYIYYINLEKLIATCVETCIQLLNSSPIDRHMVP
jgi:hypothetical protein